MFNKLEHNFGTVARGADTVYRFEVTNIYKEPMQIVDVRSSCGCTSPSVENPEIDTHETAYIVAKFNTHTNFIGRHGATLTVRFGGEFPAEVQVRVHGNIRGDVVFQPGAVQFGNVAEGEIHQQRISVNYAGRSDWRITDVTNDNDHFEVELEETERSGGRISYDLIVRLKDTVGAGYVKDQLTVVTNDSRQENRLIPLFVEGRVIPEISLTPESLVLGDVTPGEPIVKKVVVRGRKPFRILEVDCPSESFEFQVEDSVKAVHLVEITYTPRPTPGPVEVPVVISTDRGSKRGTTLRVTANVVEVPPEAQTRAASSAPPNARQNDAAVASNASE